MLDRSMSSLGKSQLQLCTHVQWKNRKMKMGFMGVATVTFGDSDEKYSS